jgi:hypothetical protein
MNPCGRYCSFYHRCLSLERYVCFFTSAEKPVWRQQSLSLPWNTYVVEGILSTTNSFSHGTKMGRFVVEILVFVQISSIDLK